MLVMCGRVRPICSLCQPLREAPATHGSCCDVRKRTGIPDIPDMSKLLSTHA